MSDKIDRFALRINGRDFPLNAAKATHDYEGPAEIELPHAIEKNGRLYDPLYDMYVDEFEDDPEGERKANEEWYRALVEGYRNERLIDGWDSE